MDNCEVVVVGAGPYGLSVAAHLKSMGVDFRIFGSPMEFWLKNMPKGMHLKSEGFASSLYDANREFSLKTYSAERNLPYADIGSPVPLETFSSYGLEFQKRYVPELEPHKVTLIQRSPNGFKVILNSGEVVLTRRVIVAVGLTYYEYVPAELSSLPREALTHSSKHGPLDQFAGREVTIVGAGASALDLAALLHEAGASVQVIARSPQIRFHDPPETLHPTFFDNLRSPLTGIGTGWKIWMCANLPLLFRQMPEEFRIEKVRRVLGPAPCWFTKERVVGKVGLNPGMNIRSAAMRNGRPRLDLIGADGKSRTIESDHVIAATGYQYDVRRLPFLDSAIVSDLQRVGDAPALSSNFESTVQGLYFIGITAANTFGPLLRFAFGAGFAAPRLSKHLARTASRTFVRGGLLPETESSNAPDVVAQ
jgi:cation diffusion facilitator CzcD-associated flavoprotein CzcO